MHKHIPTHARPFLLISSLSSFVNTRLLNAPMWSDMALLNRMTLKVFCFQINLLLCLNLRLFTCNVNIMGRISKDKGFYWPFLSNVTKCIANSCFPVDANSTYEISTQYHFSTCSFKKNNLNVSVYVSHKYFVLFTESLVGSKNWYGQIHFVGFLDWIEARLI